VEWNESNISDFTLPAYYHRAYNNKKYAFASDVLRFEILEKYGGIYLDIDQVLMKNIGTDELLNNKAFLSLYHEVDFYCGFGFIGCIPQSVFAQEMNAYFADYTDDAYVIVNKIGSEIALRLAGEGDDMHIFSQDYFYPLTDADRTGFTYSYHLGNTSWVPLWKKSLQGMPGYAYGKYIARSILPARFLDALGMNIKY
jgi:hypothetical protein